MVMMVERKEPGFNVPPRLTLKFNHQYDGLEIWNRKGTNRLILPSWNVGYS